MKETRNIMLGNVVFASVFLELLSLYFSITTCTHMNAFLSFAGLRFPYRLSCAKHEFLVETLKANFL
jgi:hypothetical protein